MTDRPWDMDDLTFFFDRSVGLHDVPDVFRAAGHRVVLMRDLYPDGRDQVIGDDEWITDVSDRGWAAVTKDANIIRAHTESLERSTIRLFTFPNANMTGAALAQRVRQHLPQIEVRALSRGPFVDGIYADGLRQRWPAAG